MFLEVQCLQEPLTNKNSSQDRQLRNFRVHSVSGSLKERLQSNGDPNPEIPPCIVVKVVVSTDSFLHLRPRGGAQVVSVCLPKEGISQPQRITQKGCVIC